jgi:hypothetical protein
MKKSSVGSCHKYGTWHVKAYQIQPYKLVGAVASQNAQNLSDATAYVRIRRKSGNYKQGKEKI